MSSSPAEGRRFVRRLVRTAKHEMRKQKRKRRWWQRRSILWITKAWGLALYSPPAGPLTGPGRELAEDPLGDELLDRLGQASIGHSRRGSRPTYTRGAVLALPRAGDQLLAAAAATDQEAAKV
jgi:hypothetical protein